MSPDSEPEPAADSAGVPWQGRAFQDNPYANDDGSADAALLAALTRTDAPIDPVAVVDAYRSARVLIPLVAEAGDTGTTADGLTVDKTQELSIVSVAAPDGRPVMPVFTSVATMAAWDRHARPIPAVGVRTAVASAGENTDLIVIDPGADTEFVLRRPAVWAIGQQQPWEPSYASPEVYRGLQESIAAELGVIDLRVEPGDPTWRLRGPELVVHLWLMHGLGATELNAITQRLATRWAADDRIAVLVDSLTVSLHDAAD